MKTAIGSLLVLFMCAPLQADWPTIDFVGQCVGEGPEQGRVIFKLYSEKMKADQTVKGFATVTVQSGNETEELGAYPATYTLSADESTMSLHANSENLEIPFGKNQAVADSSGKQLICTTKLHN